MPVVDLRPMPPELAVEYDLVVDIFVRDRKPGGRIVGHRRVEVPLVQLPGKRPFVIDRVARAIDYVLGRDAPAAVDFDGYLQNWTARDAEA